jgi:hypothetical protein
MAFLIGALSATFIARGLFLLALKRWEASYTKAIVVNVASLAVCTILGGFGFADGGDFAGVEAFSAYALPQFIWLVFDTIRSWKATNSP